MVLVHCRLTYYVYPNIFNTNAIYFCAKFFTAFFKNSSELVKDYKRSKEPESTQWQNFIWVYLSLLYLNNLSVFNYVLESKDLSQNQLRNLFPEKLAFLKMEVEQRLRGRIVRRPKEQVWMLKTDSVKTHSSKSLFPWWSWKSYWSSSCGYSKFELWVSNQVLN